MRRIVVLVIGGFILACGSSETRTAPAAEPPAGDVSAPAESSIQQLSADAKSCLDLVKAERYVDAIDPCERAVVEGANVEVEAALAESKEAVLAAGAATASAAAAAALEGESVGDATKAAGGNVLKQLGVD